MKRFLVVVIDSFGIGYMDDCKIVRPQDIGSNTALSVLNHRKLTIPTFEKLGLTKFINAKNYKHFDGCITSAKLAHFGADSFAGHQELMGSKPIKPATQKISDIVEELKDLLKNYKIEIITKNNCKCILVNNAIIIADNMETDLGQVINVSGLFDHV